MGEIRREFLGLERPFLDHVAERWCARLAPGADTVRTLFVLPGGRAARELEARLAARLPLDRPPPSVITEGDLARALARESLRCASPLGCTLAWRAVFAQLDPAERAHLGRGMEEAGTERTLARAAARVFCELCAQALEPTQVAEHLARTGRRDAERWRVLARAVEHYREHLAGQGLVDPADGARQVMIAGWLRSDLEVELVGCVDLPRSARRLIEALPGGATAWIYAGSDEHEDFDTCGVLVVTRWAERDVPLASERWQVVDGPDDQARAALDLLARIAPGSAPSQVSIGVLDAEVRPFLERQLAAAGIEPRWAAGRPFAATALARLFGLVARFLAERRFDDFAALLAHPDVEAALERDLGASLALFVPKLDDYAAEHVPARLGERFAAGAKHGHDLALARDALLALLGALAGEELRTLATWADEFVRLVGDLFDEIDLGARDEVGWNRAQSFVALATLVDELRAGAAGATTCRALEALELLLERIETTALPPPPSVGERPAIELFGWLELPLDPAPHLFVTGFDEGFVPGAVPEIPWLPERLQSELGLGHAERRLARDVWAASVLCRSRSTTWISSRRSLQRDPRVPSRLAFRAPEDAVLERVQRAFVHSSRELVAPRGAAEAFRTTLVPHARVARLRVTAFKDYLASPYLFYLRHVLRLTSVEDRVPELDPLRFGSLAHAVLQAFGESVQKDSTDPQAIAGFLSARLASEVRAELDPALHPAVRVQLEQLRARLERFAVWQARTVSEGWRIREVEFTPSNPLTIDVDAGSIEVVGRIDRIDVHTDSGRWRVIDYKTSDTGKSPSQTHRRRGEWIDLQLPLYRLLVRELVGDVQPELGYVTLDSGDGGEMFRSAKWTAEELNGADAVAQQVVADVLAGRFERIGDDEPHEPIFAALCGFGLAVGSDRLDEETQS